MTKQPEHIFFKRGFCNGQNVISYQKRPKQDEDGSTTVGLRFPVLVAADHLDDQKRVLDNIVEVLNDHWKETS